MSPRVRAGAAVLGAGVCAAVLWLLWPVPVEPRAVRTVEGLRDAVADVPEGTPVRWTENGLRRDDVTGPRVPASARWPGARWELSARLEDGTYVGGSDTVATPPGGNVLVMLFDDAGIDKIGAYGDPLAAKTPRIDALAANGVRFTRAYASPVCSPTRAVLLTGRHVRRTGVGWIVDADTRNRALPLESVTIPEMLRNARGPGPWSDGAVGKWHLAGPASASPFTHPNDSGFSYFAGTLRNAEYAEGRGYYAWQKVVNGRKRNAKGYLTSDTVDDAIARIADMPEPWFLYVAFHAPHGPLNVPPAALLSEPLPDGPLSRQQRFDAVLEALDTEIGRLLDHIDPEVLARTTVFTLGDNGSAGAALPEETRGETPHKHSIREGGIRIPFIVSGPHVANPGRVSDRLVHVADIVPTVADIAGVPIEGERTLVAGLQRVELDGTSLLPTLRDVPDPGPEWVYAEAYRGNGGGPRDLRALVFRDHKLVLKGRTQQFFRLDGEGAVDHDDLLQSGLPLGSEDAEALARARQVLDQVVRPMRYEGR